jgi:ketosteroid isomerase-like protein
MSNKEVAEMPDEADVIRRLFEAVERRDAVGVMACYADDVEIHEAAVLPYGGTWRAHEGALAHAQGFLAAWASYQGPDEIKLDPTFWADDSGTVCALFRHRAVDRARGVRLDLPEVGVYHVRDGKVVRSQMFHADSAAVAQFLTDARAAAEPGTEKQLS